MSVLTVTVDAALVEACRAAESYREQPPERPLNEWRLRHEARVTAAKVALADAVLAQTQKAAPAPKG